MNDPARASRLWLAIAVATLWVVSAGGEADATLPASSLEALPVLHVACRRPRRATRPRLLRCFRRGVLTILAALPQGDPLPPGHFLPKPWPCTTPSVAFPPPHLCLLLCTPREKPPLKGGTPPQIWNSDQGSPITSPQYRALLQAASVRIRLDGKGRAVVNIFTKRLWRTSTCEKVSPHSYQDPHEAQQSLNRDFSNHQRPTKPWTPPPRRRSMSVPRCRRHPGWGACAVHPHV